MDGYELRKHIGNITELLSEILTEIKGLREDYRLSHVAVCGGNEPVDFAALFKSVDFNKSYEG